MTTITDSSSPHNCISLVIIQTVYNYIIIMKSGSFFFHVYSLAHAWMSIIVVLMCHVCNFLFQFCEAYFSGKESAGPSFAEHARRGRGHRVRTGSGVRSGGKQQLDDPANHASIPGTTACTSYWITQQHYCSLYMQDFKVNKVYPVATGHDTLCKAIVYNDILCMYSGP